VTSGVGVGVGVGMPTGVAVGVAVGVVDGAAVGLALAEAELEGVARGVGLGEAVGEAEADGAGLGVGKLCCGMVPPELQPINTSKATALAARAATQKRTESLTGIDSLTAEDVGSRNASPNSPDDHVRPGLNAEL